MSRRGSLYRTAKRKAGFKVKNSNQLVKANEVTAMAQNVHDLKSGSVGDVRRLFTGNGDLLFVTTGDWVISQGITLRTKISEGVYTPGLPSTTWTYQIKAYAAGRQEDESPDICRKSYTGFILWNIDWLGEHFPAIREIAQSQYEVKQYW
jgi:hypothetical protein